MKRPTIVSMEMSRGREVEADDVVRVALVARRDWRAECSWAE